MACSLFQKLRLNLGTVVGGKGSRPKFSINQDSKQFNSVISNKSGNLLLMYVLSVGTQESPKFSPLATDHGSVVGM